MASTSDSNAPQTYQSMMKHIDGFPEDKKPDHMTCVWFQAQIEGTADVEGTKRQASGTIKAVGSTLHPFEPKHSLEDLTRLAGFDYHWDFVQVFGGRSDDGKPPSPEQINYFVNEQLRRFSQNGTIDPQDAVFDRSGKRIFKFSIPDSPG